jgi:threonine/homoserine/homoserine lactone efflux protein
MTLISWLTLVGVCAVGAMSPGPSLAVILQNRVQRGLNDALAASWAHAAGIFFWALAASSGLGMVFRHIPALKSTLTLAGAAFLIYLAIRSWRVPGKDDGDQVTRLPAAWLTGLSISLLNPKVFIFFTALFSQLIPEEAGLFTLALMAAVAGLVDGIWYSTVSLLLGYVRLEKSLCRHGMLLNRAAACFYLVIAGLSLGRLLGKLA